MATQANPQANRPSRLSGERLFFLFMGVAILTIVIAGFAPSWFLRGTVTSARPLSPLTPLVILHGAAFTAWMLLFIAQAGLISARRVQWHRKLGGATIALAAAMVALGILTAIAQVGRGTGPPGIPPLVWIAVPLIDMVAFSGLVWLGYTRRRDPQAHKRYMLCATLLMLQPSIGRMPNIADTPIGPEINVLAAWACGLVLIGWDLARNGRIHRASAIGIGILGGEQLLRLAIWQTEAWQGFAGWLVATAG